MLWQKIKGLFGANGARIGIEAKKNIRILIIEDNEVDQKIACSAVEHGGYVALKAYDGTTGISMARQFLPDLIILDYNLPDTKGPEVCKILKGDQNTSRIPVLFLTSMDSPGSIINCYEEGAENYLAKPVNPKFLLKQIDQALQDRKKSD